jgi:membrane dipeptidase
MERLGMMVDVSHVSDPLFWDVIRYARKPVIASHSSSRALADVPRNLSDPMLQAIARNGGTVCVNYGPGFLDRDYFEREQAVWTRVRALGLPPAESWQRVRAEVAQLPPVPLSRLVDHNRPRRARAGIDHVCLGSDFDGIPSGPAGLEDVSKLPALVATLRAPRVLVDGSREDPRR